MHFQAILQLADQSLPGKAFNGLGEYGAFPHQFPLEIKSKTVCRKETKVITSNFCRLWLVDLQKKKTMGK